MAGNVIGTSSYSEAMDLSDLDESGYDQSSVISFDGNNMSNYHSPKDTFQQRQEQQQQQNQSPLDSPIKIRKKPGRKPNPASPALRKAQNRAAQRAFRERKEKHMKELESSIKGIKEQRDRLLQDNEKITNENEVLKAENWYLKGIVLSLQLVCLQHNLVIPQHGPHVNEQTLSVLAQSIPESISSYLNVNAKGKLQVSSKILNETPDFQQKQSPQGSPNLSHPLFSQPLPSGSLIITQDGVHPVQEKRGSATSTNSNNHYNNLPSNNWYHQSSQRSASSRNGSPSVCSQDESFSNIPPLSPMSASDREKAGLSSPMSMPNLPRPMSLNEPVASNLAAIQALRLRLRLQSACVSMQSAPFAIQPTLLQLAVPHDPRIDLIPTPHMRDRMILYRDQFDLDDCFRCLLGGSVFHGGDPGVAGNWQLPAEFFEKFWFLTIDYNLRRCTNEWRKKQGLKEIKSNILSLNESEKTSQTSRKASYPASTSLPDHSHSQHSRHSTMNIKPELSYEELQGYLGVQIGDGNKLPQQQQQQQPVRQNITPIQLTNGYGIVGNPSSNNFSDLRKPISVPSHIALNHHPQQQQQQQSPWTNLMMESRDYDIMMSGLYNNNQHRN